ncbi:MAG TPA: carbon starvation protein A [Pirellulales bacterium]|nr:carbon starvation protein A [Pirellulales bacterium]
MHAMPLMIVVLCCLAIAFRFYSKFLAAKVAALDDSRPTPAHTQYDGQNYDPTNKWVLFGHHFAAISGAGPLIGPVLAIQFGYLPGLIWIVVGVCLAGAVQDMLVLAASVRHGGKSLAEIARTEIGRVAGNTASITILFVVVVALAGLGLIVVKALGGEQVILPSGTVFTLQPGAKLEATSDDQRDYATVPPGTQIQYADGSAMTRSEAFKIARAKSADASESAASSLVVTEGKLVVPAGVTQAVPGSSWGTFTIACTIPIALFVGLYMYKLRRGKIVEASIIGAAATIGVTVAGHWIPGSAWERFFSLSREETIIALCSYGFIASVLPVWLLLCPRDYLSSFLKIGTVALLVTAVIVANPQLQAPSVNPQFASGGGPNLNGAIFPFCFICIMCGAISGFHALVSSGTTPKMVSKESHVRTIGYGSMLIEGLVGVVALIAAASMPQGDYWAINIDLARAPQFATQLAALGANHDNLPQIEQQVGGESLRGRTGGAVTLAVGMSEVFTQAMRRVAGDAISLDDVKKYWYHFAIMFEALFILTTIDAGTRIARFMLQEVLGKIWKPFERTDWLPGAVLATAAVTAAWGGLIWAGSIDTIWPMFGIANQLLSVIALTVVTTWIINSGRGKYAILTIAPMLFVITTTMTAGYQLIGGRFHNDWADGWAKHNYALLIKGGLNIALTIFMMAAVTTILLQAVTRWLNYSRANRSRIQA